MNKVILMGRLTRDPEIRYSQNGSGTAVARYSLAVDRRFKRDGEPDADFFNCTCFGKSAEFAQKYLHKGTKMLVSGRIQNDNYTNKDGQQVYSIRVIVEDMEFAESKNANGNGANGAQRSAAPAPAGAQNYPGNAPAPAQYQQAPSPNQQNWGSGDSYVQDDGGFTYIPDGLDDDLPFN